jgi:hypothetical protein
MLSAKGYTCNHRSVLPVSLQITILFDFEVIMR